MTEPYYSDEWVTLYLGDCREVSEWLSADVLVSDPPYGIDYKSNWHANAMARSIVGDADASLRDETLAAWGDKPALLFGTWKMPAPLGTRQLLVWDTKGALGMGAMDLPWKPSHQQIYVLGKGFGGPRTSDVLTVAPVQSLGYNGRTHPHEKPVDLLMHLLDKCPPGTVADPFAGSGATLVAAKRLGRKAIGCEVEERYCEVIAARLSQGALDFGDAS